MFSHGRLVGITFGLILTGCLGRAYAAFLEDFESGSKTGYDKGDVVCTEGSWCLDDFLLATSTRDYTNDTKSLRGFGSVSMNFEKTNGVGEVSLYHGMYSTDSARTNGVSWKLAVSCNGGTSWDAYVSPTQMMSADWQQVVFTNINIAGMIRIRIDVTGGTQTSRRINIDDIAMSDYIAPVLFVQPGSLESFTTRASTPASAQSLVISGENLTNNATVTVPSGFELSRDESDNYTTTLVLPHTNGTVSATTVYVRLNESVIGTYSGNVVVASAGAASVALGVTGEVVDNQAPEMTGVPVQTNLIANQIVQLAILASDPDGSVVNLTASSTTIEDANDLMSIQTGATDISGVWSWTPCEPGSYTVTFTATDNEGKSSTSTCTLQVAPEWLIPIRPGETIFEDFNNLEGGLTTEALLSTGWKVAKESNLNTIGSFEAAGTNTERSAGNDLASNAGNGIYNFGAGDPGTALDRAIGFLSSSSSDTRTGNLMIRLQNNASDPIAGFYVAFDIEKYRSGSNASGFMFEVYTSTNGVVWSTRGASMRHAFAPDIETAGYAEAPGESVHMVDVWQDAALLPGESCYIAWSYGVTTGSTTTYAQALAIDNVTIKALAPPQTLIIVR